MRLLRLYPDILFSVKDAQAAMIFLAIIAAKDP